MNYTDLANKLKAEKDTANWNSIIESTLPEGLTLEMVKTVQNHENTVVCALTSAYGEKAINEMATTEETRMEGRFKFGENAVTVTTNRSRTHSNPRDPSAPIVKYGYTTSTVRSNRGADYDTVMKELTELGESVFNK